MKTQMVRTISGCFKCVQFAHGVSIFFRATLVALSKICLFARNHLFRASDPSAQQVRVYMYIFQPNSGVKQIDSLRRKKLFCCCFTSTVNI